MIVLCAGAVLPRRPPPGILVELSLNIQLAEAFLAEVLYASNSLKTSALAPLTFLEISIGHHLHYRTGILLAAETVPCEIFTRRSR